MTVVALARELLDEHGARIEQALGDRVTLLALRGVAYKPVGAASILRRNLLIYGVGGIVVPFIGIKLIDLAVTSAGLA